MNKYPVVSVIGLGKLGLPLAAALASRNFEVIGVDVSPSAVAAVKEGKPNFFEPQLKEYLNRYGKNIKTTTNFSEAIVNSEITLVIVPTPSDAKGGFSVKYVLEAIEKIGEFLARKKTYHLVVLVSTVLPLSCEREIIPLIEKTSKKKCGQGFGLCYNPEFIALGSVIRNLLNPDFVLIGESDQKAGDMLEKFYQSFCLNHPPLARMNIVNAEIAKISLNCFVTAKISFANFLAELCEKVPGGDVNMVTGAIGLDTRIGKKYLKGALGFGGPCFPRDNRAMAFFSKQFGVEPLIPVTTDLINKRQVNRIVQKVEKLDFKGRTIGVIGLAYKPDTAVIEESQGLIIAKTLTEKYKVCVYDPLAEDSVRVVYGDKFTYSPSAEECLKKSDIVVLAQPLEELKRISYKKAVAKRKRRLIMIDCWNQIDSGDFHNGRVKVLKVGLNI